MNGVLGDMKQKNLRETTRESTCKKHDFHQNFEISVGFGIDYVVAVVVVVVPDVVAVVDVKITSENIFNPQCSFCDCCCFCCCFCKDNMLKYFFIQTLKQCCWFWCRLYYAVGVVVAVKITYENIKKSVVDFGVDNVIVLVIGGIAVNFVADLGLVFKKR